MAEITILEGSRADSIRKAVHVLRQGGVIGFPTDTVYGVGAHSSIAAGIEKLYAIKRRDHQKAIPLLIARPEDMAEVAVHVPDIAWRLAERFWPGPVTIVLSKASSVLPVLTAGANSVAVRLPAHAVALRLISTLGSPLAATSANVSGQTEAVTAQQVQTAFGGRVELILDGGRCSGGVPSTVIDATVFPPVIRRHGTIVREVKAFLAKAM